MAAADKMKIYLDKIPESGLEFSQECEPSSLDLNRQDIKLLQPIHLIVNVAKEVGSISVRLKIDAAIQLNCSRCLSAFTNVLSKQVTLNIPIADKEVVDITDNLREEIILSYPLKPLCRVDCLGLCSSCGQNLNKEKCKCKR